MRIKTWEKYSSPWRSKSPLDLTTTESLPSWPFSAHRALQLTYYFNIPLLYGILLGKKIYKNVAK
jgi:hypothetical protein